MIRRDRTFSMLLTEQERETAQRLADDAGVSIAQLLRGWLREKASIVGPRKAESALATAR